MWLRILASLLDLVRRAWTAWQDEQLRQQGRKEVQDNIDANVDAGKKAAEATAAGTDPDRDKRLRERFGTRPEAP